MSDPRRGLTWSKKWHIVDDDKSNPGYDVARCGAYLYNVEKEKARHYPEHLQAILDGRRKDAGECKTCFKSAGIDTDATRLARVIALAERWENSLNYKGDPAYADRAFGEMLRRAIDGVKS